MFAAFPAELWAGLQGEGGPPGYPTLRTLVVEPELRAAGVDVLGQASKKESLILKVKVRPPSVSSGFQVFSSFCTVEARPVREEAPGPTVCRLLIQ